MPSGLFQFEITTETLNLLDVYQISKRLFRRRSAHRKACAYIGQHRQSQESGDTSMHWVEFEPTVPVSEQLKTVLASDRAVTVIRTEYDEPKEDDMGWTVGRLETHTPEHLMRFFEP
jgi:hypothetical protein